MKCIKIRELLTDYLRRKTDSQTTAAVASHLEICDDCARELAFLKTYYAKVGSLPAIEAPNNFLADIKRRLEQSENLKRKSRGSLGVWTGKIPQIGLIPQITGALTIALIVFLMFNPFQIWQKMRRDANISQMGPKAAPTEQKGKSEEMALFDSNQPQSKSAPAPVVENRAAASNRADKGAYSTGGGERLGRQTTGERKLILNVSQPEVMTNKALAAADASQEGRKGAGESGDSLLSEKSGLKKEQGLSDSNSSLVLTVKTIIGSVAGEIMQEDGGENGQLSLLIRVPIQNYTVFLEKLKAIGSVDSEGYDSPAPPSGNAGTTAQSKTVLQPQTAAQPALEQFIEARLILKGVF